VRANEATLPLVLLAASAHPRPGVRDRLARRLDEFIASRRPFCSLRQAREFFDGRSRSARGSAALDATARDLASRLISLLFARKTRRHYKRWLSVHAASAPMNAADVFVVRHPPLSGRFSVSTDEPPRRARNGCVLDVGRMLDRLGQFDAGTTRPRVECRIDDGIKLDVQFGADGWHSPAVVLTHSTLAGRSLAALGLTCVKLTDDSFRLSASSPEAIIQLSACLARGETMDLHAGGTVYAPRRMLVCLRDFDGDAAEMPARMSSPVPEDWLDRLPAMSLELSAADAAAIASWAYLPSAWATPELVARLWGERTEEPER
jgi:hypothetical protein